MATLPLRAEKRKPLHHDVSQQQPPTTMPAVDAEEQTNARQLAPGNVVRHQHTAPRRATPASMTSGAGTTPVAPAALARLDELEEVAS